MPPDPTQPTTTPEPAQAPAEHQSAPVIDPVATQGTTEPLPTSTAVSETSTMPLVAPEGPTSTVIPPSGQISVTSPEPQNQPVVPVIPPVEPAPAAQTVIALQPNPRSFLAKALSTIQFRKRAKLEKIIKLASEKKSITNDQVQKLLYVSDATASRYLLQLVKEGKLRKVGPDGRARYEPVSGSLPTI